MGGVWSAPPSRLVCSTQASPYATYAVPLQHTGILKKLHQMDGRSSLPSRPGLSFTDGACTTVSHRWLSPTATTAENGVKTTKRLISNNTGPKGEFNTDTVQRAILQYRNTPDPDTKISPVMCVFGRLIHNFIPIAPGKYRPHETWRETLIAREEALANAPYWMCSKRKFWLSVSVEHPCEPP